VKGARSVSSVMLVLVALTLVACESGDDEAATTTPAPAKAPDERATPPRSPAQLPPEFVKCMADQGFKVESPSEIHSAPPQVLQACFGSLHGGG
jgi:hypothetical protein